MLSDLLGDNASDLISAISSKVGVSEARAGGFLDKALTMIEQAIGSGQLDVNALLKGDLSSLTSALDLGSLGEMLGGGPDEAKQGLDAIAGPVAEKLGGTDGIGDLLGQLGAGDASDGLGGVIGKLGGMFGKS